MSMRWWWLADEIICAGPCRYIASMALYGISILFVGLVLSASMANYHFGTNISTFLLRECSSTKGTKLHKLC